jgi:hypothetical protein
MRKRPGTGLMEQIIIACKSQTYCHQRAYSADSFSLMVAGQGQCGWNNARLPFNVTTITYNDKLFTANVNAQASNWTTVAHTYDLTVGQIYQAPSKLRKRLGLDVSKDLSISFTHAFPFQSFAFPSSELDVEFGCDDCGTEGSFSFSFHLATELFVPSTISATITPHGVSASINPEISFSTNITDEKTVEHDFPGIPIDGLSVPDVLNIGPQLIFSIGVSAGPIEGKASISTGISFSLKDSAVLTLSLLDSKSTVNGWTPVVSKKPLSVDAEISAETKISAGAAIALVAEALGKPTCLLL